MMSEEAATLHVAELARSMFDASQPRRWTAPSCRGARVGDVGEPGPCALDLRAWDRGDFGSTEWADPEIEFAFVGVLTPAAGRVSRGWRRAVATG